MTTTTAVHKEEPSPLYLIRPLRCEGLPGADGLYQPPTRIASKIIGHEYYIDTVEVWLTLSLVDKGYIHRLEDSTKRGLQIYDGRNPTETFRRQSNRDKSRVGDRFHMRTQPWYGTKLILHGPTDATFQVLDELERLVGDGYLREKRRPIKPKRPTKTRLQQPSAGSIARTSSPRRERTHASLAHTSTLIS
jgi:hypothetical protein